MRISDWSSDVCSSDLRFEDEAERVHVAVRTDARITEKIPGAAKLFAALDEGEAMVGAIHLQMHGHADTRNAGADDQHILIDRCSLCVHGAFHRRRACHRLVSHQSLGSAYAPRCILQSN